MNLKTLIGQLRLLAILEGISYLLIGITVPMKYFMDMGMPNKIVGMIHGVLFITYCIWVYVYYHQAKWKTSTLLLSLLASIIPFGTFIADARIFKKEPQA